MVLGWAVALGTWWQALRHALDGVNGDDDSALRRPQRLRVVAHPPHRMHLAAETPHRSREVRDAFWVQVITQATTYNSHYTQM